MPGMWVPPPSLRQPQGGIRHTRLSFVYTVINPMASRIYEGEEDYIKLSASTSTITLVRGIFFVAAWLIISRKTVFNRSRDFDFKMK